MEYIPMRILEYKFEDNGITQQIKVQFQSYQGQENFNGVVILDENFIKDINSDLELDTLNKIQIDNFARRKLRDWMLMEQPKEVEEEATE